MRILKSHKPAPPKLAPIPATGFFSSAFPNLALSIITIVLLAAIGWFGYNAVEREMKNNLSIQLQAILLANVHSLQHWIEDKKMDAEVLAGQPEIRKKIISLIKIAQKEDAPATVLKQSRELLWLRKNLGNACKKYGFVGFVVLDPTGFQVGTLLDDALGKRQLIERSDFFYRSLQGDTVVSHPFPGEVDLPDDQGNWRPNRPTMFASSPIRNDAGKIVGVLAFRFRPEMEFTHMLEVSRFGKTGESFAFNGEGLLLTQSRFFDSWKKLNLIADDANTTSILNVQLSAPEKKSTFKVNSRGQGNEERPLTRMAASAVTGESGVDVDGYASYRGEKVVGAWTWLLDQYMGVATEIDAREALGPLYFISQGFLTVFGLLIIASLTALLMHLMQSRMQRERNRAQENVREREKVMESLAKFSSENPNPVLRIGNDNKLLYANSSAFHLLDLGAIQAGDQVCTDLQTIVTKALASKSIQEIEIKVGNQIFLLEGVPFFNEGYVNIYGQDITKRKKAELKLNDQAKQRGAINKLGLIALPGNDIQELMDLTVHLLSRTLDAEYAKILHYIPEERAFLLRAGWGWKEGLVGKARMTNETKFQAGFTFNSKRPAVVKDLNLETRFSSPKLLVDHGIVSGMSVVIQAGTQVFGVLGVHSKKIRVFTLDEVNFLQSMANVLGNAIERKNAEEKLEQKARELERSNQELEDFAFIASHDLQEPLRKVMLFGDRIKSFYPSSGDDRGKNYIDRLQNSMNKMQNFIHDLLEYSRITRASAPFKKVNLEDIVSEALNDLEAQIKRTQGTVEVLQLPSIDCDPFQLVQLFQNLISNALKYAKENVTPRIRISSRAHGNSAWDILVQDNGIGIDPKYFHKIFKPFERLHSSDQYDGTGIGLAICIKVLTRHGGNIRIVSQPGKGSTFIITLPKGQSAACPAKKTTDAKLAAG